MSHLSFENLAFEHTAWRLPPEGQGDSQAASGQPAAIELDGVRHVTLRDCVFARTGSHAVWFRKGCRDCLMERCHVYDLGGGAVRIGDRHWQKRELPDKLTARITVDNNILQQGGRQFPGATGVWIGHASDVQVTHNDIGDFLYTGISMGWTWGYAETATHRNILAFNHIHHIGQGVLSDMGGIYTLGISEGSRVTNNHIHDVYSYDYTGRGGWGLYTDEGSRGIVFENNLVHHVKTGCLHQHYGRENIFRNNILAYSMNGQVQRSKIEEHTTMIITNNIFFWDNDSALFWRGSRMGGVSADVVMDSNTYWNPGGIATNAFNNTTWEAWREEGHDAMSQVADPLFRDAPGGDFRLDPRSPAIAAGFKPFDYRLAGVYGPRSWRRLAARHKAPPVRFAPVPERYVLKRVETDFEAVPTGSGKGYGAALLGAVQRLENKGEEICVTEEAAFSGKRSLKVQDAEGLRFAYNPHFFFKCVFTNGTIENSFAVNMAADADFFTEWRDLSPTNGRAFATGPRLVFKAGEIRAPTPEGERKIAALPPNEWVQVTVTLNLDPGAPNEWGFKLRRKGHPDVEITDLRFHSNGFQKVNWLGFCSMATHKTHFYLDDFYLGPKR